MTYEEEQLQHLWELNKELTAIYERFNAYERGEALAHCLDIVSTAQYEVFKVCNQQEKEGKEAKKNESYIIG